MRRGSLSVSEYGQKFRNICDQLAAIGAPVANDDKVHWFPVRWDRSSESANLAQSFAAGCSLDNSNRSDWYMDTGATSHMTHSLSQLTDSQDYSEPTDRRRSGKGPM
ncbi:uncharacterized protein LOC130735401 [Lotus japonicus]|uniref:uncharacterized protein LOC130735401 n=1 Tax=Lotus japonicus TaxID=34305 RepID=UPI00258B8CC9|nr:uncharacterized protein LOC130735401 [Lotus japonicus]